MKLIYADSDLHIPYEGDKNNYNFCISRERQIEVAILEYAKPKNHDKLFEISENNSARVAISNSGSGLPTL